MLFKKTLAITTKGITWHCAKEALNGITTFNVLLDKVNEMSSNTSLSDFLKRCMNTDNVITRTCKLDGKIVYTININEKNTLILYVDEHNYIHTLCYESFFTTLEEKMIKERCSNLYSIKHFAFLDILDLY